VLHLLYQHISNFPGFHCAQAACFSTDMIACLKELKTKTLILDAYSFLKSTRHDDFEELLNAVRSMPLCQLVPAPSTWQAKRLQASQS
jgi:hypothetical protein